MVLIRLSASSKGHSISNMSNEITLVELLDEDFASAAVKDLGLSSESAETQADVIETIGSAIVKRLALEIYKIVPNEQHETFDAFMDTGDILGLRAFLAEYIQDVDQFVLQVAQMESEKIKTRMKMIEQGL